MSLSRFISRITLNNDRATSSCRLLSAGKKKAISVNNKNERDVGKGEEEIERDGERGKDQER